MWSDLKLISGDPYPAKLISFNSLPLEFLSRYPQPQVSENYLKLIKICLIWARIFAHFYV